MNEKKISPRSPFTYLYTSRHSFRDPELINYREEQLLSRSTSNSPRPTESLSRYRDDLEEKVGRSDSPVTTDGGWTRGKETATGDYMDSEYKTSYSKAHAYHYPAERSRRPLVDLLRNGWRSKSNPGAYTLSPDREDNKAPRWTQVARVRRLRKYILSFLLLQCICLISWNRWLEPMWNEHISLKGSLDERIRTGKGWFGTNMRPKFADIIQVKNLNANLIPRENTRLIVVGDVHGCKDELVSLLAKLSYQDSTDHLILTGDIISKGPHSSSVVSLAMSLNASCVRGNHEDRVLLAHRDMNTYHLSLPGPHEDIDPPSSLLDTLDEESFSHGDYVDRNLAKSLNEEQIAYLAACPLILRLGDLKGMGYVSVVHAGLVPGVDFERQDPSAVMSMRTVDLDTHVPSRDSKGVPWTKLWNKYQSLLPKRHRQTIIYGHDSRRGLSISKYSKGLDTGCVKGGKLTALVIEERGKWYKKIRARTFSIRCRDYRARKEEAEPGQV